MKNLKADYLVDGYLAQNDLKLLIVNVNEDNFVTTQKLAFQLGYYWSLNSDIIKKDIYNIGGDEKIIAICLDIEDSSLTYLSRGLDYKGDIVTPVEYAVREYRAYSISSDKFQNLVETKVELFV